MDLANTLVGVLFSKLLEKVIPGNFMANSHNVFWHLSITKKGIGISYARTVHHLTDKEVRKLVNDQETYREYMELKRNTQGDEAIYTIKSQNDHHTINVDDIKPMEGHLQVNKPISFEELYKIVHLRKEVLPINSIRFENVPDEYKSRIRAIETAAVQGALILKSNNEPDLINYTICLESNIKNQRYFVHPVKMSVIDYDENTVTLDNRFEEDALIKMTFNLGLNNSGIGKFQYKITERGSKDVKTLLTLNTINRLVMQQELKLTINDTDHDCLMMSGVIDNIKISKEERKELITEARILNILKKAEEYFSVKFEVPEEITEIDLEVIYILEKFFEERLTTATSKGPTKMSFKSFDTQKVVGLLNGKITIAKDMSVNIFGATINGITKVITFYNAKELGFQTYNRKRYSDGSLEIKFNQYRDRRVEIAYIKEDAVSDFLKKRVIFRALNMIQMSIGLILAVSTVTA